MESKTLEVKGRVQAINSKTRNGIMIDDEWYNATPETREAVMMIEKGNMVNLRTDVDGRILSVEPLETPATNNEINPTLGKVGPQEKKPVLPEEIQFAIIDLWAKLESSNTKAFLELYLRLQTIEDKLGIERKGPKLSVG